MTDFKRLDGVSLVLKLLIYDIDDGWEMCNVLRKHLGGL